jgi:hypothetical protein
MLSVLFLVFFLLFQAQVRFELQADTEYVLKVPAGYDKWSLVGEDWAYWCYIRDNKTDVKTNCFRSGWPTYMPNTMATIELVGPATVKVVLKDGRRGWLARDLVDMTPEQWKEYRAEEAARAKRAAQAKALREKEVAAVRMKEAERQAKEKAYLATLPKLHGPAAEVLVATSLDCARDHKNILEFGRRNGTGVEFRKKILELISLGCAVKLPSGTPMLVSKRDRDFVTFCAYNPSAQGACGVALVEYVAEPAKATGP